MADNITIKDGSGASVVIHSKDDGSGKQTTQSIPSDTAGVSAWGTAGVPNTNILTAQGPLQFFARVKSASGAPAAVAIKGAAGVLKGYSLYNNATYPVFIKFYNVAAGSVTVGTTTPAFTVGVPPGASRELPTDISFGTAMSYAITKLVVDTDTTAVVADDLHGVIPYV